MHHHNNKTRIFVLLPHNYVKTSNFVCKAIKITSHDFILVLILELSELAVDLNLRFL
jgi:hypothetical protein